jgi:hypothetical protein
MSRRQTFAGVLGLVLALGISTGATAQNAVLQAVAVQVQSGQLDTYLKRVKSLQGVMERVGGAGTLHAWRATLAGQASGTVFVAIEYPSLAAYAESTSKVQADAEWKKLIAGLDDIRTVQSSGLYRSISGEAAEVTADSVLQTVSVRVKPGKLDTYVARVNALRKVPRSTPHCTLFPYTTLFRSEGPGRRRVAEADRRTRRHPHHRQHRSRPERRPLGLTQSRREGADRGTKSSKRSSRSENPVYGNSLGGARLANRRVGVQRCRHKSERRNRFVFSRLRRPAAGSIPAASITNPLILNRNFRAFRAPRPVRAPRRAQDLQKGAVGHARIAPSRAYVGVPEEGLDLDRPFLCPTRPTGGG